LSVGKNALTPAENAADDYRITTQALAPFADYIAINVSSPNTAGLRRLQGGDEIRRILQATRRATGTKPVFVKIAPELEEPEVRELLEVCLSEGASGIIATNTLATANMQGLPEGGLSGYPLRERALELVGLVRNVAGDQIALIGCGGIDDADSAQRMFDAGADLVQVYTGLVYKGPFLPAQISRELALRDRP
jgi:dihydroorotate dehydrogenase